MDVEELELILGELRRFGTDTQDVEAKRAAGGLPASTSETLSAFGNSEGGLYLLGVDEGDGEFKVTGVESPKAVLAALQAEFAEMSPPIRGAIDTIDHPDGVVIAARIPPTARNQRPTHRRAVGEHGGSFIRVGDGDQRLSAAEVTEMLAARAPVDDSAREVDGDLDPELVDEFVARVRASSGRDLDREVVVRNFGIIGPGGKATVASLAVLGDAPERHLGAARVAYQRHPTAKDPRGARHEATHLEGTVGQLLDDTLARLARDLPTIQVDRAGAVVDDSDVPRTALRELVSNALVHRSFTDTQLTVSVDVDVFDDAVAVTSPGGIHIGTDPATLGMLGAMAGVRNLTLIRIAEQMTTPVGVRIVEQQNMGIRSADTACRIAGVMPPLFADLPTSFRATLLRGALDVDTAAADLKGTPLEGNADAARLLAAASRLEAVYALPSAGPMRRVSFDARFAARVLAPSSPEDATVLLSRLTDTGLIERVHTRSVTAWRIRRVTDRAEPPARKAEAAAAVPAVSKKQEGREKVLQVLSLLAAAPGEELRSKEIGDGLGLKSPSSRNRWIRAAEDAGFMKATKDNPFDPAQSYVLTTAGRSHLAAAEARQA